MIKIYQCKLLLLLAFLITLVFPLSSYTSQEPIKIAVIDIKRVINTSKYGQEVMDQLQKKYEELQAKLESKGKELEALREEIEKKGPIWSQEMREKKQSEYQRKLREFKTLQEDAQFEMQELERKLLDPVFKELEIVIRNFVEKEKYDLILEKTQPGIYFVSTRIDLSPVIVDLFNKHYDELKRKRTTTEPGKPKEQAIKELPKEPTKQPPSVPRR